MKQYRKPDGFTVPEMLITASIISIVLATAVPSISSAIKDNRLVTQLNAVMADIYLARSEAAKRDTRVILCRSGNTAAAVPSCSGNSRIWTSGYLVFADDGNYSNNIYDAGTDTYHSSWTEMGVGCTQCHGEIAEAPHAAILAVDAFDDGIEQRLDCGERP